MISWGLIVISVGGIQGEFLADFYGDFNAGGVWFYAPIIEVVAVIGADNKCLVDVIIESSANGDFSAGTR